MISPPLTDPCGVWSFKKQNEQWHYIKYCLKTLLYHVRTAFPEGLVSVCQISETWQRQFMPCGQREHRTVRLAWKRLKTSIICDESLGLCLWSLALPLPRRENTNKPLYHITDNKRVWKCHLSHWKLWNMHKIHFIIYFF